MYKYLPFEHFWNRELKQSQKLVSLGRAVCFVGVYGVGLGIFAKVLQAKLYKKTIIINVSFKDLPNPEVKDIYSAFMIEIRNKITLPANIEVPESTFEFHYFLRSLFESKKRLKVVFVIEESQNLLKMDDTFFDSLEQFRANFQPRVSFILIGLPSLYNFPTKSFNKLTKNKYYFIIPFNKKIFLYDLAILSEKYNRNFFKFSSFLFRYSHGLHGVYKYLCSLIAFDPKIKLNKSSFNKIIVNDPMMDTWYNELIINLNNEQKKIVRIWLKNHKLPKQILKSSSYRTLARLKIFRQKGPKLFFLYDKFENYLLKKLKSNFSRSKPVYSIHPSNKELILFLSFQERIIFDLLFINFNKIVSYEMIANKLWHEQQDEKYSLWAINKVISRIRSKLPELEMNRNQIRTVRKVGYMLTS